MYDNYDDEDHINRGACRAIRATTSDKPGAIKRRY